MLLRSRLLFFGGILLAGMTGCASLAPREIARPVSVPDEVPAINAFVHPLAGSRVISPFGRRGGGTHAGVDLRKSDEGGDAVGAARAGVVEMARRCRGYGLTVMIAHPDGSHTRYAHLAKILVAEHQHVDADEQIGIVGSTGNATRPHLHFEILTSLYHPVDPSPYLEFIARGAQPDRTGARTVSK